MYPLFILFLIQVVYITILCTFLGRNRRTAKRNASVDVGSIPNFNLYYNNVV